MYRRSAITLQVFLCAILLAIGGQARAYMEDNLLVRYDFNKGRGTVVSDQTGLGYQATLHGNAAFIDNDPWQESTGMARFGNAIKLDGTGDYLLIDSDFHNARLNFDSVAIAAWIRPTEAGAGKQYIVSKLSHAAKTGYAVAIDTGTGYLHAEFYRGNSASVSEVVSNAALPKETWTHIVAVFDGTSIALYVNGAPDNFAGAPGSIAASGEQFTIGALSGVIPTNEFSGAIDELRLYSTIGAADIATLAAAENGEPDLILYESFDTISRIWADAPETGATFRHLDNTDLVEGLFDNALHFQDGHEQTEQLSWPTANNLDTYKGHITLWFRPDWAGNSNNGNTLLETENRGLAGINSGDGIRIYRWINGNNFKEFRFLAGNNYVRSRYQEPAGITAWAANEWHHLELIWDLTGPTPYLVYIIDGELAWLNADATLPANRAAIRLFLGAENGVSGMDGTVDELKIYSRPQYDVFNDAERIAALMAANRADGHKQGYETVYNSADAPFPDAAMRAKGAVVFFQTAPFEPVFAGDVPAAADVADTLNYNVAKNDTESLFFSIYSQIDADDVHISMSDLVDSGGTTIVAAIDMRLTIAKKWWQKGEPHMGIDTWLPVFMPELLMYDDRYNFKHDDYDEGAVATHSWDNLPDFPIPPSASVATELKAFTSKQFALNVTIPRTAAAGTYTTTATVTVAGLPGSRALALNIHVQDIALPKADKDFIIYHRAQYLGSPGTGNFRDFVRNKSAYLTELMDIAAHGFNGIDAYGTDPDYITDIAGAGFDGIVILPNKAANPATVAALKGTFGEAWFHGVDEPAIDQELEWQMESSRAVHALGGKSATAIYLPWADCLSNPHRLHPDPDNASVLRDYCPYTGSASFDPDQYLDLENLSTSSQLRNTQAYFRGLLNGTITRGPSKQSYYWQARAVDARVNRYMAGIHLFLTGLDGIWPYVYIHNSAGDPFDDFDLFDDEKGEFVPEMGVVYPTQQGPMSTMGWEAMREGIDDYRYLQLWQSLHDAMIAENPGEAARSGARIELNEEGIGLALFRHQLAGALNLSHADFAATRKLIGDEILLLQAGLADPDGDGLSTAAEHSLGTDPLDDDTDNDWLRDGIEVNLLGTDPLNADSDDDRVNDFMEMMLRTNPLAAPNNL
jgi:hypothetical protein